MVADNDREYYLQKDYQELAAAAFIRSEYMRTWIYYDAWNQGNGQVLFDTVDSTGKLITEPFSGSRIITYDASLGKLKVDVEYSTELNSDQSTTLDAFLQHAMEDCLANGYESLFLGMAGYGGDFWGFGGDENQRYLLQLN